MKRRMSSNCSSSVLMESVYQSSRLKEETVPVSAGFGVQLCNAHLRGRDWGVWVPAVSGDVHVVSLNMYRQGWLNVFWAPSIRHMSGPQVVPAEKWGLIRQYPVLGPCPVVEGELPMWRCDYKSKLLPQNIPSNVTCWRFRQNPWKTNPQAD